MKNSEGEVLYVGKAKNLRNRLRSYLNADRDNRPQIRFLLDRTVSVETIITDTEQEAFILENTLIKQHRPRYNIHLRDDKTFVSLRIDLREEFPAIQIVRSINRDGARYFGPFASSAAVRQTLKEIYRIFPLRHYPLETCRRRGRPCLFHQIGQCSAPCHGMINVPDYRKLVDGVIALLSGRQADVVKSLKSRMDRAAAELRYEEAAALRDQVRFIEQTLERQKTVSHNGGDQDVVGLYREGGEVEVVILFFRGGRLNARRSYNLDWRGGEAELLEEFLCRFYDREVPVPDEVLLPVSIDGRDALATWLGERRQKKVRLLTPRRGERLELVSLAARNARESWKERGSRREARRAVLEEVRGKLHLSRFPSRMECFDISTIHGDAMVGSMAVVLEGEPAPKEYRHYRVKSVRGTDDYAALREVLRRRLERGRREGGLPDFILIDGGKGQLGVLKVLLEEMSLAGQIDLAGIAKSRVRANARGKVVERSEERFFLPGRKNPVRLRGGSSALFLLERLRDEAHRFAITHHRKVRGRRSLASELAEIPGVGPTRQRMLLKFFGSVKQIRSAGLEELKNVPGLPGAVAEDIHRYLNPHGES
jgi:excinuclease ABC subunit C